MVIYVPNSVGPGSDAPTLFWFGFYLASPWRALTFFLGFTVDHSQAVRRAILQSMAPTSPLRPNPSLQSSSTGLAV